MNKYCNSPRRGDARGAGGVRRRLKRGQAAVSYTARSGEPRRTARPRHEAREGEGKEMRDSTSQGGAATVSKPEAVRRAIAALGYRAELSQILEYVHRNFGIDAAAPPAPAGSAEEAAAEPTPRAAGKRRGAGNQ